MGAWPPHKKSRVWYAHLRGELLGQAVALVGVRIGDEGVRIMMR